MRRIVGNGTPPTRNRAYDASDVLAVFLAAVFLAAVFLRAAVFFVAFFVAFFATAFFAGAFSAAGFSAFAFFAAALPKRPPRLGRFGAAASSAAHSSAVS